jgi:hypothetical protein
MSEQKIPFLNREEYIEGSFENISIPHDKIPYRIPALRCCGLFDECGWPLFFSDPSPERENISILNHIEGALPTTKNQKKFD